MGTPYRGSELAVTSATRSAALPDLPTVAEAGGPLLQGCEASSWFGLLAPTGTPAEIVNRLQQETAKALATPVLKERLLSQGPIPSGVTPAGFAKLIGAETRKWAQVVSASVIRRAGGASPRPLRTPASPHGPWPPRPSPVRAPAPCARWPQPGRHRR